MSAHHTNPNPMELENTQPAIHELEIQLRESEQMLRAILDTLPAYVFWKDLDLRFLGCNRQMAEKLGFGSPEEIVGKTDFDLSPPEFAAKFQADDRRVIKSGEPTLNYEEPGFSPTGEQQWLRTSKMPLYNQDGKIIGIMGFFQDITAEKREIQERDQIQQQIIEEQQRALYELSTPIIPIVDGVIVMPLIGSIDGVRAQDIMRSLLQGITQYKAGVAILDVTGVPVVDTDVAQHLDKTVQAARLKGTRTMVTGISEVIAETIVDLGINWDGIETLKDLQTGLKVALQSLGLRLGA